MSYEKLLQNITESRSKIEGFSGLDIRSLLLSDSEVVKNLIHNDSPSLDKDDINLIVDGFKSSSYKKDNTEEKLSLLKDQSLNLLSDLQKESNKLSTTDKELSNKMNEQIKDSKTKLDNIISKTEQDIIDLKNEGNTPYKSKLIDESLVEQMKTQSTSPMPTNSPYYSKAKKLKNLIIEKVSEFIYKVIDLIVDCVLALINMAASIPGGILMLSPFAFNAPGMVSLITSVIQIILNVCGKYKNTLSYFSYFEDLNLVLPEPFLTIISEILNVLFSLINTIFGAFNLNEFIGKAKETITSNCSNEKNAEMSNKVVKRLRKLKYFYIDKNMWYEDINYLKKKSNGERMAAMVSEEDEDEVESLLKDWTIISIDKKTGGVVIKRKNSNCSEVLALLDNINVNSDLLKVDTGSLKINNTEIIIPDFKNLLSNDKIKEDAKNIDIYVYDIQMPNGQIIFGLTEEELNYYKDKFLIIYSNDTKFEYSSQTQKPIIL